MLEAVTADVSVFEGVWVCVTLFDCFDASEGDSLDDCVVVFETGFPFATAFWFQIGLTFAMEYSLVSVSAFESETGY